MKTITSSAIRKFTKYLICEEKSKATQEKYLRDIKAFRLWLGKAELCKAKVLDYKEYLIAHYAPASVNSILSSLNCFFERVCLKSEDYADPAPHFCRQRQGAYQKRI